jgi:fluoroacetyl-CoA thioesterase
MKTIELKPGLIGEASELVTEQHTASKWGSGLVVAFATPAMVGLMESASVAAIENNLVAGTTSVGIELSVKHLAPTPIGMRVTARAELLSVHGRRLEFKVEAWDEKEKIGEGTHWRAVVDAGKFMERVREKTAQT